MKLVGRSILCSLGKLSNRHQGDAEFLLSDPRYQVFHRFGIPESSGREPPDSRQFVVIVWTTNAKDEVAVSDENGDRALDRPGHVNPGMSAASLPAARYREGLYRPADDYFRMPYEISTECNRAEEEVRTVRDDTSLQE